MKQLPLFAAWDPLEHGCGVDRPNARGLTGKYVRLLPRIFARRGDKLVRGTSGPHLPDNHAGVGVLDPRSAEPQWARMLCHAHARFEGSPTLRAWWDAYESSGPWGLELIWHSPLRRVGHILVECVRSTPVWQRRFTNKTAAKRTERSKATVKT